MISVWVGSLEGLHHVCHIFPMGILAPLHVETHTYTHTFARKLPIFSSQRGRSLSSSVLLINEAGTAGCPREAGV